MELCGGGKPGANPGGKNACAMGAGNVSALRKTGGADPALTPDRRWLHLNVQPLSSKIMCYHDKSPCILSTTRIK
jgi:hypothetical protein